MAEHKCPSCGEVVPSEIGQHADNLLSGTASCPHCGKEVTLETGASAGGGSAGGASAGGGSATSDYETAEAAPPGRSEDAESFSGHEDAAGLAQELRDKPQ